MQSPEGKEIFPQDDVEVPPLETGDHFSSEEKDIVSDLGSLGRLARRSMVNFSPERSDRGSPLMYGFVTPLASSTNNEIEELRLKSRTLSMDNSMVLKPTSLYKTISGSTVDTPWTLATKKLIDAETVTDFLKSLEEIADVLNIYDDNEEALKCCKEDFSRVIREKRAGSWYVFDGEAEKIINKILVRFFNDCELDVLPEAVLQRALALLTVAEAARLCAVASSWQRACDADALWRPRYLARFPPEGEGGEEGEEGEGKGEEEAAARAGGGGGGGGAAMGATPPRRPGDGLGPVRAAPYKELYRRRLWDPLEGDRVEVSWKGKFRLEAQEVYSGQAWWAATVVRKMPLASPDDPAAPPEGEDDEERKEGGGEGGEGGAGAAGGGAGAGERAAPHGYRYKIHYPGWDARWDEWVLRGRLRWAMRHDPRAVVRVGDYVEVWCTGQNVPGAWLEAQVKQQFDELVHFFVAGALLVGGHYQPFIVSMKHSVKDDEYFVGKMLSSGPLWVNKERVRLAPRTTLERLASEGAGGGGGRGRGAGGGGGRGGGARLITLGEAGCALM